MVQPGLGLDTPRTNLGEASFLDDQPDFNISPEKSFHEPSKDTNLLAQLRNGRRGLNLNTPRSRAPFSEKQNLFPPSTYGGGEFTPLLKTATRNSARKFGKENTRTPARRRPGSLDNVAEELSPGGFGSSVYAATDVESTPAPQLESSSATSSPTALFSRRNDGGAILQNGALALKEQENVIDKIEKENFGLKLKIHFLEEALRKAGPGFSEAALKENTDLKVDKVTMQKELLRFRKNVTSLEQQLEQQRRQVQLAEQREAGDSDKRADLENLQRLLEERESELYELQQQLSDVRRDEVKTDSLREEMEDMEAEMREKDRLLDDREDQVESLKSKLQDQDGKIEELEDHLRAAQRRNEELEDGAAAGEDFAEAKETIEELEAQVERLKHELQDSKEEEHDALLQKRRAEDDLEELRNEMSDKAALSNTVSRQLEEKSKRLQCDLDTLQEKHQTLINQHRALQEDASSKSITSKGIHRQAEQRSKGLQDELDTLQQQYNRLLDKHRVLEDELSNKSLMPKGYSRQAVERSNLLEEELAAARHERDDLLVKCTALQEELSNKSVLSRGTARQFEDKSKKVQEELLSLRQQHQTLQEEYALQGRELKNYKIRVEEFEDDADARERKLLDELNLVRIEHRASEEDIKTLKAELRAAKDAHTSRRDEKDLLQNRHDALTSESASLQREIVRTKADLDELQLKLDHEKAMALANERELRDDFKRELDRLRDEVEDLKADVREKERMYDEDSDKWTSEKRQLESQRDRAEEQAAGLKRTVDRFKASEGSQTGRESRLQDMLSSEKDRHAREEALLSSRISELEKELRMRLETLDDVRNQLSSATEELRLSDREQKALLDRVQGLEDEIEVLSAALDEDGDQARDEILAVSQEADMLRKQLHTLKQDLTRAETAATEAKTRVDALQGDLLAGESSKEHLSTRVKSLETQLSRVRTEKQQLQDQSVHLKAELIEIRASLDAMEAERDEAKLLLEARQADDGQAKRLDQEKTELRKANSKLGGEMRRLQDEHKALTKQHGMLEQELQQEVDRANELEERIHSELTTLQSRKVSNDRDVKKTIQRLQAQVRDLETQLAATQNGTTNGEISVVLRDLSFARSREKEYIQREVAHKETSRKLKRYIHELETRIQHADTSHDPYTALDNTMDSIAELGALRDQLHSANQIARDLRSQLKSAERNASKKSKAIALETNITSGVDQERARLERDLAQALLERDEIAAKSKQAESGVSQYKSKIDRLERELQAERLNKNESQTIVLERRDLHHMLRTAQIELEQAQRDLKARNALVVDLRKVEDELRTEVDKLQFHNPTTSADVRELMQRFSRERTLWEEERRKLTSSVRFPHASISAASQEENQNAAQVLREVEEREKRHLKELRGLAMQIEWLRARCKREESLRRDAAYAKKFMQLQIEMFEACNQADLRILRNMGINPAPKASPAAQPRRLRLHTVAVMVRAVVRMRRSADKWAKSRRIHERLVSSVEASRKRSLRKPSSTAAANPAGSDSTAALPAGSLPAGGAGAWRGRAVV